LGKKIVMEDEMIHDAAASGGAAIKRMTPKSAKTVLR
jgi:hypothetical protein